MSNSYLDSNLFFIFGSTSSKRAKMSSMRSGVETPEIRPNYSGGHIVLNAIHAWWKLHFFQVELAKWFYDDEYVNTDAALTSCTMRDFCEHIFRRIPFLL